MIPGTATGARQAKLANASNMTALDTMCLAAQHSTAQQSTAQGSAARHSSSCKQQRHAVTSQFQKQGLPLPTSTGSVPETEDSRSYLHIKTHFAASFLNNASNVIHAELLCELVVDSHLSSVSWVVNSQLYAPHLQPLPTPLRHEIGDFVHASY